MANTRQHSDESDPLLPPAEFISPQPRDGTNTASTNANADENIDNRTTAQRLRIAIPCVLTLFSLILSDTLNTLSVLEIREDLICRRMYPEISSAAESSNDPRCKDNAVLAELAFIQGWELTFVLIPSILTGVPWGIAADKYGRTFVLQCANFGVLCSLIWQVVVYSFPDLFPIRFVWLQGIFLFMGGGASTYVALLFTITSDVSTKAQRSTAMFYFAAILKGFALVCGPIVYLAMRRSAWFALYLGVFIWCLSFPLTAMIPETRSEAAVKQAKQDVEQQEAISSADVWWDPRPVARIIVSQTRMVANIIFLRNIALGILLFSTLFTTLGRTADTLLVQYASKRFYWTYAEASFLLTFKGFISLGLTAIVLPLASQMLRTTFKLSPIQKDWSLVFGSICMLIIGSAALTVAGTRFAFIASLVLFQLGGGYEFAFRSLITELVDPSHIAMLFTAMSVFMTLSDVAAGPMIAALYKKGLELGGRWLALPFFVSTILFCITAVITFTVRVGQHPKVQTSTS